MSSNDSSSTPRLGVNSLREPLKYALERRIALIEQLHAEATDCYRLFHGTVEGVEGIESIEGVAGLSSGRQDAENPASGVTVDRYGPQLIIQSFHRSLAEAEVEAIVAEVGNALGAELLPFYHDRQQSQRDGSAKRSLSDVPDQQAVCSELGVNYRTRGVHRGIDPLLFLDLRVGRRYIQQQAAGLSVLNLFAYTCGVGVAAAKAGADRVVNVDFARSSLAVGRENAELNALGDQIEFIQSDFFPAARQLAGLPVKFRQTAGRNLGRGRHAGRGKRSNRSTPPKSFPKMEPCQFDLVFLDPPRWAKSPYGTVDLIRDYPSVLKPSLLATKPGGRLICSNNVAQVDAIEWLDQIKRSAAKAGRPVKAVEWLTPEADFPSFDGNHPLKLVVLEV